jgi:hypothetical protein
MFDGYSKTMCMNDDLFLIHPRAFSTNFKKSYSCGFTIPSCVKHILNQYSIDLDNVN